HRSRVLVLNLWYTLGLLSVFLVLATLACGASLGLRSQNLSWGEQFSSTTFNIVMSAVVFVMALSFLGVWEIPIPGFVGSGKAVEAASHEGAAGAFAKGVLSTVLATPCSGPLLGSVFGFTLQQSPGVIYAIFGAIGLGMASPYLVIGAFPQLIRLLPKPGAWMDTFQHIMGFVLLGTVVFLFTFLARDYVVPTFGMLVGLWAACWWIGHVPLTAELGRKLITWAQGAVVAVAAGYASFALLLPHDALLPWQPFSPAALAKLRSEGKTVMVDFTADWCLTCKTNLKFAINTPGVLDVIKSNDVVPLLADWTDGSQEIKDVLTSLQSNSIPVVAIFPGDRPNEALVLRDLISQSRLLDALRQAGPSQSAAALKQTVMQ
ncbi:MAG TPA: thioredoxin family protein, partial [Pirellulales bacterium]